MTSPREKFLARVEHRTTGRDHGVFRVPTRRDRNMSGTWRELADGRLLVHDHGGDGLEEILAAIGLELADLFPPSTAHQAKPDRQPFPAADVLRALQLEVLVVLTAAADVMAGKAIDTEDRTRLAQAVGRIRAGARGAGL